MNTKKQKKILGSIIVIALIFLISNPMKINANFLVIEGQTFNYTLENANLNVTRDGIDYSYQGMRFDTLNVSEGTTIVINTTEIDQDFLNYTITIDGVTNWQDFGAAMDLYYYLAVYLQFNTQLASNIAIGDYNYSALSEGIYFMNFVNPILSVDDDLWEYIAELPKRFRGELDEITEFDLNYRIHDSAKTKEDVYIFEWILEGSVRQNQYSDFAFVERVKFAYGTDGVLKGLRLGGEITGLVYDVNITLATDYLIEQEGYDLGEFEITPVLPIQRVTVIVGVILTTLTIQIFRRSKRKKLN